MGNRERISNFVTKIGKMRKFILSLVILTVALSATATERSAEKMRQAALKTLNRTKAKSVISKKTLEVYSDGMQFSIVSRDDRFPEVLAYGYGNFDIEQAPDNVKWWFDRIQHSMEIAIKENTFRRAIKNYSPIAPLMETKWGQGTPYNNYAPIIGNEKAPTGCVATAMAQMMNYQRYPASASFEGSYTVNGQVHTGIVSTEYSWPYKLAYGYYLPTADAQVANMSYLPSQGNSVARLMQDCGYAVNMDYALEGSGAFTYMAGIAFTEKFGYPQASVKYLMREYYSDEEWMDLLHTELENDSPILYAGSSNRSGGHAFVFHGMDTEGRFFVNWGWQGQFDGYYAFDILNPDGEDFSEGEEMVIGVRSTALPTDIAQSCFATDTPYEFSYDNTTKELTTTFTSFIFNATCYNFTGRWSFVIEDLGNSDNTEYLDLDRFDEEALKPWWGYNAQTLNAELTFDPGSYRIYFATLDKGETNWQYVRTIGGPIYYDMTVTADGVVTIAETPTYTTSNPGATAIREIRQQSTTTSSEVRYYDLQGREVNGTTKGVIIRRQGNETKKVVVK